MDLVKLFKGGAKKRKPSLRLTPKSKRCAPGLSAKQCVERDRNCRWATGKKRSFCRKKSSTRKAAKRRSTY